MTLPGRNTFVDINKVFSEVPAAWAELEDLGTDVEYQHLEILSTLNNDIEIRFKINNNPTGAYVIKKEIRTDVKDDFKCNGILEWKHSGTAPTSGLIKIVIW